MPDSGLCEATRTATFGDAVRRLADVFRKAGMQTPALDARVVAAHAAGLSQEAAITKRGLVLSRPELQRIDEFAARRLAGEPVSRILGCREFWGLTFNLSPQTLDPRPETELLVETVLDYVRQEGLAESPLRILDLGAGTGCLLGSLLWELPAAQGVGSDLSEGALATARENLYRLGLLHRSTFLCANWLDALGDSSFDIIVCNPPYISSQEIAGIQTEVRTHDPHLALDGGDDGFEAFRAILAQAFRVLRQRGLIVFETGYCQARRVRDMMIDASQASVDFEARILADLSGTERVVAGVRQWGHYEPKSKKKVGNPALSG